jgi:glycosyltransferase involved in cell wall biosynthesis
MEYGKDHLVNIKENHFDFNAIPVISICLITYNHVKYIEQAIESVLIQNINVKCELIIADDCSTDGTSEIITNYQSKYPHLIKLIINTKNTGGGKNFVNLINSAKGKYISYFEGDDYFIDSKKLHVQYSFLEKNEQCSMCYHPVKYDANYYIPNIKNAISNKTDGPYMSIFDVLEKGWQIRTSSMFFRKIKLPEGFEYLYIGDYPLHVLLAHKGLIGFINLPMSVYRINNQGLSESVLAKRKNLQKIFSEEMELIDFLNINTNGDYAKFFEYKKRSFALNILMYRPFLSQLTFKFWLVKFIGVHKVFLFFLSKINAQIVKIKNI